MFVAQIADMATMIRRADKFGAVIIANGLMALTIAVTVKVVNVPNKRNRI